jgi:signal transduction histidine kinase
MIADSYRRPVGRQRWVLAVAATVILLAAVVAAADIAVGLAHPTTAEAVDPWLPVGVVARTAPVVVGALLVVARPRNAVAWVLLVAGVCVVCLQAVRVAATAVLSSGVPAPAWVDDALPVAAMAPQIGFGVVYAWPAAVVLLFPDGGPTDRGSRALLATIAGAAVAIAVTTVVGEVETSAPFAGRPNPLFVASLETPAAAVFALAWLVLAGALTTVAVGVVRRMRGAHGSRRLELRWLLAAAVLPPVSLVACVLAFLGPVPMASVDLAVATAQLLVVGAVVVAVTRHGLYDIDRLLNRALVYAVLTPVLLAVFVVVTAAAGWVLGGGSRLATAVATAAAAAVFLPARAAVQRGVDRFAAPRKAAAAEELRAFADRVHRGDASPADVVGVLARVVDDPDLRVRFPIGGTWLGIDDEPVPPTRAPGRTSSPVRFAGTTVGVVDHSDRLTDDPELLRAALDGVTPTLAVARLQLDVRHQLRQVEASRERIVLAGLAERRRLERDLHDGAQQRLVALGIFLRRIQSTLPREAARTTGGLDAAVAEVAAAIRELRTIAAGVRPARLHEGLRAALDDLAGASPVPVLVDVPDRRLADEVEATAYFVACEAVTNAIKHADPSRVLVDGRMEPGELRLAVVDDGRGGAAPRPGGGGLVGMTDRARSAGGTVTITSPPGAGTRVELVLPCG